MHINLVRGEFNPGPEPKFAGKVYAYNFGSGRIYPDPEPKFAGKVYAYNFGSGVRSQQTQTLL